MDQEKDNIFLTPDEIEEILIEIEKAKEEINKNKKEEGDKNNDKEQE